MKTIHSELFKRLKFERTYKSLFYKLECVLKNKTHKFPFDLNNK